VIISVRKARFCQLQWWGKTNYSMLCHIELHYKSCL